MRTDVPAAVQRALHRSREMTRVCSPKMTHPRCPVSIISECSAASRVRAQRAGCAALDPSCALQAGATMGRKPKTARVGNPAGAMMLNTGTALGVARQITIARWVISREHKGGHSWRALKACLLPLPAVANARLFYAIYGGAGRRRTTARPAARSADRIAASAARNRWGVGTARLVQRELAPLPLTAADARSRFSPAAATSRADHFVSCATPTDRQALNQRTSTKL
jgi:hypothetical protein